jgi:hypothetical protein
MNVSAPLKALALLVFLAALAGATYGVQQVIGTNVAGQVLRAEPVGDTLNATPGNTVAFPIVVSNRDADARNVFVALSGEGIDARSSLLPVAGGKGSLAFVPVAVPAGLAPGDHALDVRILGEDGATLREAPDAVTLRVLAPGPGYQAGQDARYIYTGRFTQNGAVFTTNDAAMQTQPFLRAQDFRPGVLPPATLLDALVGMQPGESRTFSLPADQAYGNVTEETIPSEEILPRRESLPLPTADLSDADFASYLEETNQTRAEGYKVGDTVTNVQDGETLRYRIIRMEGGAVSLRLDVAVGEGYTVYGFWPRASVVDGFNETHAEFVTTPTTDETQPFTFFSYWPDLSRVASYNDTDIVVRHDPPVGHKYSRTASQFQPPVVYTVRSLTDREIVVTTPTGNPFANQAVTFDVRMQSFA